MGEHADAVAELQHEIRARQDVGIAAADLDEDGRLLPRQVEIAKCSAHHRRAGSKHAQIVEIPAVRDEVAVGGFAQDRARLRERFLRARVCCSPLPSSKAVPASLRAAEQGKQGNRTRGHRKLRRAPRRRAV